MTDKPDTRSIYAMMKRKGVLGQITKSRQSVIRNVFAVLAHDKPESVHDLVLNLQRFDPSSQIVLYDGGTEKLILSSHDSWKRLLVDVVPNPKPQVWGRLHEFAIECINHVRHTIFDTITFVDSDQLLLKRGYSEFLTDNVVSNFGVLSTFPCRHGVDSNILCVRDLHADRATWLPYLSRFHNWEEAFVRWTFWPGTVLSADAARAIADEFGNECLMATLERSRAWATEECIIPTVSALLGFREMLNPCNRNWCRFRTPWTTVDMAEAIDSKGAFFAHPVRRSINDPVRAFIRNAATRSRDGLID